MANEVGNTELSATKQEIISEIAQRALYSQSVLAPTMTDYSNRAVKGASSVSIPKFSDLFTVENRASATAGSNQNLAFGKDTIALDQRAHIQWLIDSDDEIESTLDVQREYIQAATQAHAADFDANAIAIMNAAGIETTTTGNITQDIVLEMRAILLRNKARAQNLFLAVGPGQEANLLKIDPFISADKYGGSARPLVTGALGTIYGVQVVMTPEVDGVDPDAYFMYSSEGISFAFQRGPAFDERRAPEFGVNSMLQVLAQKYGQKALQVGVPGAFAADGTTALTTQSAHIVRWNDGIA